MSQLNTCYNFKTGIQVSVFLDHKFVANATQYKHRLFLKKLRICQGLATLAVLSAFDLVSISKMQFTALFFITLVLLKRLK